MNSSSLSPSTSPEKTKGGGSAVDKFLGDIFGKTMGGDNRQDYEQQEPSHLAAEEGGLSGLL